MLPRMDSDPQNTWENGERWSIEEWDCNHSLNTDNSKVNIKLNFNPSISYNYPNANPSIKRREKKLASLSVSEDLV